VRSRAHRSIAFVLFLAVVAVARPAELITPEAQRRPAEQTFLTFPEWFLVFSPAEYAAFVTTSPPSEFPFLGHVRQFWAGYRQVWRATRDRPFNIEYHVMIVVIGVSTTVEYAARSAYENLFGRVSALAAPYGTTAEDQLAARVARDYVDFIRKRPWYEFDFVAPLRQLWATPALGRGFVRKWERRYALTTEYATKAAYGWLLGRGSTAAYGVAESTTAVVVDGCSEAVAGEVVMLPRYDAFKDHAAGLAARGCGFVEIAGNRGPILVSALVPAGWSSPVVTQPGRQRMVVTVPVAHLAELLLALQDSAHELEHVYDY
jgi:hypothetical protein